MVQQLLSINFIVENFMKSKLKFGGQLGHTLNIVGKSSMINN
jgi:hypothetical protein